VARRLVDILDSLVEIKNQAFAHRKMVLV